MSRDGLTRMLAPSSVAVVGASAAPGKAGNALMVSLSGFGGEVHPINPRARDVLGRTAAATIGDLPSPPDLALLAVPAEAVPGVVADCAAAGVGGVIVHAGGFAEAGDDGRALQERAVAAARAGGTRLLGPNTSGFIVPSLKLCATFVASTATLPPGPLAIVAQSGGVNHALAFGAAGEGLGIRLAVGLGNAADVDIADVLERLADDPEVGVVALALEGVRDGRRLTAAVERLVDRVPVVALKLGRADVGDFAQSHTGALTGSWRVTRSALRQAGAVVVDDSAALLDAARALSLVRLPPARRPGVGLVTGQAGPGLLLADALTTAGVDLPTLDEATQQRLGGLLGALTYQRNPVDTGRPGPTLPAVLREVSAAPGIDALAVYLLHEPDAVDPVAVFDAAPIGPAVVGSAGPAQDMVDMRDALAARGVPLLPTPERAAQALVALVADAAGRQRLAEARSHLAAERSAAGIAGPWDEDRAKELVAELGIAVPRRRVCSTAEEAQRHAADLGFPLVVKLLHPALTHKSELGAVKVGIGDATELAHAIGELQAIDAPEGTRLLIEQLAPAGPELIVGAVRDPEFGPAVLLGAGGVAAEAAADVATRLAPLSPADAGEMLDELATAALFRGFRGGPAVDEAALAEAIAAIGGVLAARDDLAEIEINPLRVTRDGLLALDALVVASR